MCLLVYLAGEVKLDDDWPSAGEIVFNNVSIRYSGNACPVARNLNIHIQPGEKACVLPVYISHVAFCFSQAFRSGWLDLCSCIKHRLLPFRNFI